MADEAAGHPTPGAPEGAGPTGSVTGRWYADPWRIGGLRWWDGAAWTSHVVERLPVDGAGERRLPEVATAVAVTGHMATPRAKRLPPVAKIVVLALAGAFVLQMGSFGAVQGLTWRHGVAVATIGRCAVDQWASDTGATRCDVAVAFRDGDRTVHAVITDVDPADVHGVGGVRTLRVTYDPTAPDGVQVDGTPLLWTLGVLALGVVLLGAAAVLSVRLRRDRLARRRDVENRPQPSDTVLGRANRPA